MIQRIGLIAVVFLLAQCGKNSSNTVAPPMPLMGAPSQSAAAVLDPRNMRAVTIKGGTPAGTNATNTLLRAQKFYETIDIADNVNCILSAMMQTGVFPTLYDGTAHTISYNGTLVDKFIAKAVITTVDNQFATAKVWLCDTKQATRSQTGYTTATVTGSSINITAKIKETNGNITRGVFSGQYNSTGLWVGTKDFQFNHKPTTGSEFTIVGKQGLASLQLNAITLQNTVLFSISGLTGNIYRNAADAAAKNSLTPPPNPLFAGYALGAGSAREGGAGALGAIAHYDDSLADTGTASAFATAVNAGTPLTGADHAAGIAAAAFTGDEIVNCDSLVAEKTFEELTANLDSKAGADSYLRGVNIGGNIFTEAVLNVCL